jgi:predicted deacetylase
MNWDVWNEVEKILLDARVSPLIAVVPDNQDPGLQITPPAADFWDRVRTWQGCGWSIALHGYQHRYVTQEAGLIGLNRFSEFAGLPESVQAGKIQNGLAIFEREGVKADAWIAPAHSFDAATLRVLARYGPRLISDGFARWPFVDRLGLFWVPQQLWWFARRRSGVWTVCFHCNPWKSGEIERFRGDLIAYRQEITSLTEVIAQFQGRQHSMADTLDAAVYGGTRSKYRAVRRIGNFLFR